MKKLFTAAIAALAIVGCQTLPSEADMDTFSRLIGATGGQAVILLKLAPADQNMVVRIVEDVQMVVPMKDETFQVAWMPIAELHVDAMIQRGELDKDSRELVLAGVNTACLALDYMFAKHPEWRQSEDLVKIAVHGFCEGFLAIVRPIPTGARYQHTLDQDCMAFILERRAA